MVETGERSLTDYLVGVDNDLESLQPFGRRVAEGSRVKLCIDLKNLNAAELDTLLEAISSFTTSESVNCRKGYLTEEQTLSAATGFLKEMAANNEWLLLRFYAGLFSLAHGTSYLRFYGTGTRGFSVKLEVIDKGEISLCTIYRNKTLEFSLKR
jgi:hypothetical protein